MVKKHCYNPFLYLLLVCLVCTSCDKDSPMNPYNPNDPLLKAERMIIQGQVTDFEGQTLPGIRVALAEAEEVDYMNYNYAITGTDGRYRMVRYVGRSVPEAIVLEAVDSSGVYASQTDTIWQQEFLADTEYVLIEHVIKMRKK